MPIRKIRKQPLIQPVYPLVKKSKVKKKKKQLPVLKKKKVQRPFLRKKKKQADKGPGIDFEA